MKMIYEKDKKIIKEIINPYNWSDEKALTNFGISNFFIGEIKKDSKQARFFDYPKKTNYLGASMMNLGIRIGIIQSEEISEDKRYLEPLKLARILEIPYTNLDTSLFNVFNLIDKGESKEYVIDVSNFHFIKFKDIKRYEIKTMNTKRLMRCYRYSGKNKKYTEEIIKRHEPLIVSIIKNLKISHKLESLIEFSDLENAGIIGLLEAANRYSLNKDVKFESYAFSLIKGRILDQLREFDWKSRTERQKTSSITKFINEFLDKNQREASVYEIANEFKIKLSDVYHTAPFPIGTHPISIDQLVVNGRGGGKATLHEIIPSSDEFRPDYRLINKEKQIILEKAISYLSPFEQDIIVKYFYEDMVLKKIGDEFDLSESRMSQVLTKIYLKLKKVLETESF